MSTLTIEKSIALERKNYDFWQHTAKTVTGCYISNTATKEENPEGKHRVAVYARDKKNIVIDGNGATLTVHGILTPFFFDGCKNVTLKNFTLDYSRPTMSEMLVERREGEGYVLRASKDTFFEIEGKMLYFVGESVDGVPLWKFPYKGKTMLTMYYKDKHTAFMKGNKGDSRPSIPTFQKIERLSDKELYVELAEGGEPLPVGAILQNRSIVREEVGSCFTNCENIRLENITCRAMHGLGMVFQNCKNIVIRHCDFTPKTDRTIASNADFFHFSSCRGKIVLDGVQAAGAHDDFVNVHGTYVKLDEVDASENAITVRFCHEQSFGYTAFSKGDRIAYLVGNTFEKLAYGRVKRVQIIDEKRVKLYVTGISGMRLMENCYVENLTKTASLLVKNCHFGHSMGRGILCSSPKKAVIKDNVFEGVEGTLLLLAPDCNEWFESSPAQDVTFKRNRIVGCCDGVDGKGRNVVTVTPHVVDENYAGFVHKRLQICKNEYENMSLGCAFQFSYIRDVAFVQNSYHGAEVKITKKQVGKIIRKENFQ